MKYFLGEYFAHFSKKSICGNPNEKLELQSSSPAPPPRLSFLKNQPQVYSGAGLGIKPLNHELKKTEK